MRATINGVTVEGTLEEVWDILQRHNAQGTNLKPKLPTPPSSSQYTDVWWGIFPPDVRSTRVVSSVECTNDVNKV